EVGACAAVLLRHAHAQEPDVGEARQQRAREAVLAIPLRGVGCDLGLGDLTSEGLDRPLLRRQLEVHGGTINPMRWAALGLGIVLLTGCGFHAASPESVVRAWSASLNRNDNEGAARLFADGAKVIQDGETTLETHADAVSWNAGLPCGGRITSLQQHGDQVSATFALTDRPHHLCGGPGQAA